VEGAPHSVTVVAATCLEAGTLSTLAALRGAGAETFLQEQGVTYWIA
jgi:thiamine biosynthesis lipoprotein